MKVTRGCCELVGFVRTSTPILWVGVSSEDFLARGDGTRQVRHFSYFVLGAVAA